VTVCDHWCYCSWPQFNDGSPLHQHGSWLRALTE
jgi:hypothetical protein